MSYMRFAVLGMGAVAVYALLAQGVVIIYRASGIINFAQGSYAMVGAYAFYQLKYLNHWPLAPALVGALAICTLLGALTARFIIRPLRRSSPLVRLIATLAVLSALQTGATIRYTDNLYSYPPFLPHQAVRWGSIVFPEDRVWLFVIAIALTIGLHLFSNRTAFGLATYGMSENEMTAETLGWSPTRISVANWAIGGLLAGVAGIFIVPISGLSPTSMTLLLIPALAAALVGQFSSFGLTLAGAALLGVAQSEIAGHVLDPNLSGLPPAIPFIVIIVVLVVRGKALPLRGYVTQKLPTLGSGRIRPATLLVCTAGLVVALLFLPKEWIPFFSVSEIAGLFILSVIVLTGYAGQLSLAQYAIGGVAALVTTRLVVSAGVPFTASIFIGVAAAAAAGLVFAIPALRTRGVNLAVVTIGLGVAIYYAVFSDEQLTGFGSSITVGPQRFLGVSIDPLAHPRSFAIFALLWLAVGTVVTGNIRRSRAGRRLIAVRSSERSAAALGINVYGAKIFAFAVSASLAGIAGVLLAFNGYAVVFTNFDPLSSVALVEQSVLGGIGHLSGVVYGSQFAQGGIGTLIGRGVVGTSAYQWVALVSSLFVILIVLQNPNGLASENAKAAKKLLARFRPARVPAGAGSDADLVSAATGAATRAPLALRADSVSVSFGGVAALSDVSIEVRPGEIVGLIGPNGAGKTTLIDVISGFTKARSGSVRLGDLHVDGWSASKRARLGLVRTFQSLELFDDLTVIENLRTATDPASRGAYLSGLMWPDKLSLSAAAQSAIDEFGLSPYLGQLVAEQPYGRRRLVAIARALAAEPSVLLLDEPTAGLDRSESADFASLLRTIPAHRGIGILLVEHDMSVVMGLCTRIVVLNFGKVIAEGTPEQIRSHPQVVEAYLGYSQANKASDVTSSSHVTSSLSSAREGQR